ncbi:hypothetical protein B0H16DRAFT_1473094 [Mycena metata]|uniref:Uncharacterized protein n=1 Tax=Mycena metata TaxID=1033252 RepID=A0AAD7HKP1_9AGAR|nr:hypothetical protein B0H16DRAFT_1473094 [Mycena metata]
MAAIGGSAGGTGAAVGGGTFGSQSCRAPVVLGLVKTKLAARWRQSLRWRQCWRQCCGGGRIGGKVGGSAGGSAGVAGGNVGGSTGVTGGNVVVTGKRHQTDPSTVPLQAQTKIERSSETYPQDMSRADFLILHPKEWYKMFDLAVI